MVQGQARVEHAHWSERLIEALQGLAARAEELAAALAPLADAGHGAFTRLRDRLEEGTTRLRALTAEEFEGGIRWAETSARSVSCHYAPVDVAEQLGALLAAASAEDLGRRITQGTDPANWAEAVAALGGLEAVVDREAAAGRLVDEAGVRSRLAAVRVLLEFPMQTVDGQTERFSSPRDYDAPAIGEHLRVIASALGPSARGLGR